MVKSKREPKVPPKKYCSRPFYQLCINYKGKVVLCCNDYYGVVEIGDVHNSSIKELWGSEIFMHYRKELLKGNRSNLKLCNMCDVNELRCKIMMIKTKNYIRQKIAIFKKKTYLWRLLLFKKPKYFKYLFTWIKLSKSNPLKDNVPWLTFESQEWLDSFLNKNMTVLEWGSGGSTIFISKKVKKMISIEHNPEWYASVVEELQKNKIKNCEYILKRYNEDKKYKNYYEVIDSFPDKTFDLVVVDGRSRNSCIFHAMKKIRKGGFLFLDNSERKRYSPGIDLLRDWERKDIQGIGKYDPQEWQATVWKKI